MAVRLLDWFLEGSSNDVLVDWLISYFSPSSCAYLYLSVSVYSIAFYFSIFLCVLFHAFCAIWWLFYLFVSKEKINWGGGGFLKFLFCNLFFLCTRHLGNSSTLQMPLCTRNAAPHCPMRLKRPTNDSCRPPTPSSPATTRSTKRQVFTLNASSHFNPRYIP